MREEASFGRWLRQRRKALDLTQDDLAQQVGYSAWAISKIETGARRPSRQVVERLLECLQIPPEERQSIIKWARVAPETTDTALATGMPAAPPDTSAGQAARNLVAPRHQLRPPVADYVGRAHEAAYLIAALHAALAQGCGAVISGIQGMGGIGKTELAYHIAHQLADTFCDAQIVLEMRGSSAVPLTSTQALQLGIYALAPDAKLPDDHQALEALYRSLLHGQRALILADDAHNAAQIQPLIPPQGCALLITSRQRFTLPGMASLHLEQLGAQEAIRLLRDICSRLSMADARTIAEACGYLPLALRISSSILHNDPALLVADYLAKLADERQRLRQLRDPDNPQLDMAAALALSYAQLDEAAQQVFRQLGIFVADFATDLALAAVDVPPGVDTVAILHLLLRRNLVMYDAAHQRWRLHDLVRDLAFGYLEAAGELDAVSWHYARAAVRLAAQMEQRYQAGGDAVLAALAWFDAERPHIDAARRWAVLHAGTLAGDTLLLEEVSATDDIGDLRYDIQRERISQLKDGLAATQRLGDRRNEARLLSRLGTTYRVTGDVRQAISAYEQALAIVRSFGDRRSEAVILANLGNAYGTLGDTRRAIPFYEQGLIIAREIDNTRLEAGIQVNLSAIYTILGEHQRAIPYLEQGLIIARKHGDRHLEGYILRMLGSAAAELGETRRANTYLKEALAIAQAIGDRRHEANALIGLGLARVKQGDARRAVAYLEQALTIGRAVGAQREQGHGLSSLGRAYAARNDMAQATSAFTQALAIFAEIGDRSSEAECRWYFGLALAQQDDLTGALPHLQAAVAYQQEIGHARAAEHAALLAQIEARANAPVELIRAPGQYKGK